MTRAVPVTPPVDRATVGRKVVGRVTVEPVVVGPGFFLRIVVVGLIAGAGEVRMSVDRCAPPVRSRR
ncbi:hypothetical protein ACGFWI_04270 [Streptomyces sp. NPDC048434]|uniref:hypothetical protein n=1 Tax=Streptomyces sp. NPDC048434 TaxID=3365549 RepID=UPI003710CD85